MITDDIKLALTPGTRLTTLSVCPDFSEYNELMQRAVVLLLCSESPDLRVNGYTLLQAVTNSTSEGIRELKSYSSYYASALKTLLNSEQPEVDSLSIDMETDGLKVIVKINITAQDGEELSGGFTL